MTIISLYMEGKLSTLEATINLTVHTCRVKDTFCYKFFGKVTKNDIEQLKEVIEKIQEHTSEVDFVLDFSCLDDFVHSALRQFIIMQMEARKRGRLYVLMCNPKNIKKFKDAGAVREAELYRDKYYLAYFLSKVRSPHIR